VSGTDHLDDAPVSIVLADDHAVMRTGLRMLLQAQPELEVVAEVGTIQAVLGAVRNHRPALLLLDLNMPGGSSVDAIRRLSAIAPETAVIVLTMERDPTFMRDSYAAGAAGFVLKEEAANDLIHAIRRALRQRERA
jgi:two-component system response regulator NreC